MTGVAPAERRLSYRTVFALRPQLGSSFGMLCLVFTAKRLDRCSEVQK